MPRRQAKISLSFEGGSLTMVFQRPYHRELQSIRSTGYQAL
jgi:hypothetical protein